jgi:hypothetical protein
MCPYEETTVMNISDRVQTLYNRSCTEDTHPRSPAFISRVQNDLVWKRVAFTGRDRRYMVFVPVHYANNFEDCILELELHCLCQLRSFFMQTPVSLCEKSLIRFKACANGKIA